MNCQGCPNLILLFKTPLEERVRYMTQAASVHLEEYEDLISTIHLVTSHLEIVDIRSGSQRV